MMLRLMQLMVLATSISPASADSHSDLDDAGWWCTGNTTFIVPPSGDIDVPLAKTTAEAGQGVPCKCPAGCYACTQRFECRACTAGLLLVANKYAVDPAMTAAAPCLSPSACRAAGGATSNPFTTAPPGGAVHLHQHATSTPLFQTCKLSAIPAAAVGEHGDHDSGEIRTTTPAVARLLPLPPHQLAALIERKGRGIVATRVCTESQVPTADVIILLDTTSSLLSASGERVHHFFPFFSSSLFPSPLSSSLFLSFFLPCLHSLRGRPVCVCRFFGSRPLHAPQTKFSPFLFFNSSSSSPKFPSLES